jgi:hypothetical protein
MISGTAHSLRSFSRNREGTGHAPIRRFRAPFGHSGRGGFRPHRRRTGGCQVVSWHDDARIDRAVENHISVIWPWREVQSKQWTRGRNIVSIPDLRVLEVHPSAQDGGWVYASVGVWRIEAESHRSQEFILLSPEQSDANVELLAMIASAHNDARYRIRENAIFEIGRPWLPDSLCDHILVAQPYFLDEDQDRVRIDGLEISYLWLVPITSSEAKFGRQMGGHVLFHEFADAEVDLLKVDRPPLK